MIHRAAPGVAALCFALGGAVAQVQKGAAPPSFEFEKVFNDGPTSFEELDGRVVILDFSATW